MSIPFKTDKNDRDSTQNTKKEQGDKVTQRTGGSGQLNSKNAQPTEIEAEETNNNTGSGDKERHPKISKS